MPNDLTQLLVLVVDPDRAMSALTRDVLKSIGIAKVDTVGDAERAFGELRANAYDIVITERDMAPTDGIALTKTIRTSGKSGNSHVAILMMTAMPTREMVTEARDAGVTEFLIKPFSMADLRARIIAILRHPRSFIEESDYFGPDRRRADRDYYGEDQRGDDPDR
ncbi:MAG: response regulator [Alphaproteobacteria bacterium]